MVVLVSLSRAMNSKKVFLGASTILLLSTLFSFDYYSNNLPRHTIPITGAVGPESFAFDPHGQGPYTGVSDGRIIRWQQNESRWIDFAFTAPNRENCEGIRDEHICGRPLGLGFNEKTSDLYIADAYMGLLVVGPNGGWASKIASEAQGVPFGFTNGLEIDQNTGHVYFTDSSLRYQRRNHIYVVASGDATGRLMKYDPKSKEVSVLLHNLSFPNGVALSKNCNFILIADTTNCKILKFWLQTSKAGKLEDFAELPGFPDNIKRTPNGEFWVGIHSRRGKFMKRMLSLHLIRNFLVKLPFDLSRVYMQISNLRGHGLAVKLSEEGVILEVLDDKKGNKFRFISEVEERSGKLWVGSVRMPYAGVQSISK